MKTTEKANLANTPDAKNNTFTLRKMIGSTIYLVNVYFNPISKETLEDKILRLMEREAKDIA